MSSPSSLPAQNLGAGWGRGIAPHSPSEPWEEQRSSQHVLLLPAALGFLFLCAVPSRAALPTKNRKSLRTLGPLRSCHVTLRLCCVPCVSRAGKGIDPQRAPAQSSSSGCPCASPSITDFHSSFWAAGQTCRLWAARTMLSPASIQPFVSGSPQVHGLLALLHMMHVVHANSSAPACRFPFPGAAQALWAWPCSPVCFQALSSISVYIKAIYLFCGIIPGLDLEPLGRG